MYIVSKLFANITECGYPDFQDDMENGSYVFIDN